MDDKKLETFVPRITQLDANEFDREIHNLLKNSVFEISRYVEPAFLNNVKPEIDLIIRLLVFKYSLFKSNSTFGQQLLNVQYNQELTGKKAVWYSVLNIFLPYLKNKYDAASLNWNHEVRKAIDKFELVVKTCQLLNLLIFLQQGTFANLVDRILGMKVIPKNRLNRNVGFSYMTRELLWHGFMELFMFALPLINYSYLRRKLLNLFSFKSSQTITKSVIYDSKTVCIICGETLIYPCRISIYCEHVACYYCLKSNVLADSQFRCSICGAGNTESLDLFNQ